MINYIIIRKKLNLLKTYEEYKKLINYIIMKNNSNDKILQHFCMINKQRWFIHDKLKELGYEDN